MDLSPYVERLRQELVIAAEAGGEEARVLAERLTAPLESSLRLALLSALSAAAEEITSQLAPGSVDVRLRGIDIGFVVTPPAPAPDDLDDSAGTAGFPGPGPDPRPAPPVPPATPDVDDGNTSRITLRLPEHLKARVEEAAGRQGVSVNTWLVRAVTGALEPGNPGGPSERRRGRWSGQHYSGWVQ
jgi:hypothetical protein